MKLFVEPARKTDDGRDIVPVYDIVNGEAIFAQSVIIFSLFSPKN